MWILNYVKAPNDVNGNPRRGWHAILKGEGVQVWIEEGYRGRQALMDWWDSEWFKDFGDSEVYEAGEYTVSAGQRRLIRKFAERIF
jgi:hypothetical protein